MSDLNVTVRHNKPITFVGPFASGYKHHANGICMKLRWTLACQARACNMRLYLFYRKLDLGKVSNYVIIKSWIRFVQEYFLPLDTTRWFVRSLLIYTSVHVKNKCKVIHHRQCIVVSEIQHLNLFCTTYWKYHALSNPMSLPESAAF